MTWKPGEPFPDHLRIVKVDFAPNIIPKPSLFFGESSAVSQTMYYVYLWNREDMILELHKCPQKFARDFPAIVSLISREGAHYEDYSRACAFRCAENFVRAIRNRCGQAFRLWPLQLASMLKGENWNKPGRSTGARVRFGKPYKYTENPDSCQTFRVIKPPINAGHAVVVDLRLEDAPVAETQQTGFMNVSTTDLEVIPDWRATLSELEAITKLSEWNETLRFPEADEVLFELTVALAENEFDGNESVADTFHFHVIAEHIAIERGDVGEFVACYIEKAWAPFDSEGVMCKPNPHYFAEALLAIARKCGGRGQIIPPKEVIRANGWEEKT